MRGIMGLLTLGAPMTQGGGAADVATFTVTTTGAQTLTIDSLGVASGKTVTIDWGDGQTNDYTGTATRTHAYAGAGVWTVTIHSPQYVVKLDLRDAKITKLNSADIADMQLTTLRLDLAGATGTFDSADIADMALTYLRMELPKATGTFDSADIADMALTNVLYLSFPNVTGVFDSADIADMQLTDTLYLSLPNVTGVFNSADIADLTPSYLLLRFSSATVVFDSADIAGMEPSFLYLYLSNATVTVARTDWSGTIVRKVASPVIQLGLSQAQVDAVLLGIYDGMPSRTASGGTLYLTGNAAPSGTLQAACPPTTGRSAAYELVNDSCGVIPAGKEYAAVTINS